MCTLLPVNSQFITSSAKPDKQTDPMNFSTDFRIQMEALLGDAASDFFSAMSEKPSVSIKMNVRKASDPAVTGYGELERVKWCRNGYYLPERPLFTLNPLLHAGVFYVQDASSMIYEAITDNIVPSAFDTGTPLNVLDLCAAPGGKTTSLINALPDGSLVVANEFIPARAKILKENLIKWGYPDIIVTSAPTSRFASLPECFDIVAVDAPCSGEGMMRKDETALLQWGPGLTRQCATLQREILEDAVATLRPGGFLIYSTCTFNRTENEDNLRFLVEDLGLVPVDMEFPSEWGISSGIDTPYPSMRFMPHITRGEGLFAAVLHKEGENNNPLRRGNAALRSLIASKLKVICDGIPRTITKGKDTVPACESVLATDYKTGLLPETTVDRDTALSYLRHEALRLGENTPRGYVVIKFEGHPLGLVKNIGSRANNLYPQGWKIRIK